MLREVTILYNHIKPSRSKRNEHRQKIVDTCRAFSDRYPDSKAREEVLWRMSQVYLKMGDKSYYSKAVDTLEEMGRDFPKSVYLPLYEAAEISRSKLKDKSRARRLYQAFLESRPDSDKASKARDRLKKL
jgi:TolA-binding protein